MNSVRLLALVIAVTFGYTQAPDTLWTKTYGGTADDVGNSIKQTSDGGYIIAGSTESFGAGQQDVWILKTDANGDTVWTRTYGSANNDWAEDVQQTTDGGYIIAANTYDTSEFIWLIKTDSLGDSMWTKTCDWWPERALSIQQTSDSGYIVTGGRPYYMFMFPGRVVLMKTDTHGDTAWCKYYYDEGLHYVPYGRSLCETFDGGYVVAGSQPLAGPIIGGFLIRTDASGDIIWDNEYWFKNGHSSLSSVRQTVDSGYVACGSYGPYYNPALWIVRTNAQGALLWTREYGDSVTGRSGNSMQVTNDNGYIFTGGGQAGLAPVGDLFLFKTDEYGDSLWCAIYGGVRTDRGNDVLQTNDGGYIIVGFTASHSAGGSDVWIIKTEPDVHVEENDPLIIADNAITATIFRGSLQLPEGKKCKVFDITGRVVEPDKIQPGIYFIEVDGVVTQKVVKVR